jgi:group II intron reverse transcriptase/maturase
MNVEEVQRRLWEQSKAHKENREASSPLFPTNPYDSRVRNLSDLIHHPVWLEEAAKRTFKRSKGKAPGIDGVTVSVFQEHEAEKLQQLRLELKKGTYRPQPLKRAEVPKANGTMRQLGLPCLRDKIVQEAIRMMLEPIFEVEFHDSSYGFRPHRSAHHAIFRCQHMMKHGFSWVIEGDVKACFDEISHKAILGVLREKVMDNKFLDLITLFLKSGVMVGKQLVPTVKGVPQGGVISPLLANAVLNKLDWFLHEQGAYDKDNRKAYDSGKPNIRFVRYADDWCVFITRADKHFAETFREKIRQLLKDTSGLELSVDKTHITHVRDGFDFLGFHLEKSVGQKGKLVPKIKVAQKSISKIRLRLNEVTRYRPSQEDIETRVTRVSSVIRGWSHYFKIAHNYSTVAGLLDCLAHWAMVKAISRKNDISSAKVHRNFYFKGRIGVTGKKTLVRFADTKMSLNYKGPVAYEPGKGVYLEDYEWEANFLSSSSRPGQSDLKLKALERDGYQCRSCGCLVLAETSALDHITEVRKFASFKQANTLDNVQTLCLYCHKEKHRHRSKQEV